MRYQLNLTNCGHIWLKLQENIFLANIHICDFNLSRLRLHFYDTPPLFHSKLR